MASEFNQDSPSEAGTGFASDAHRPGGGGRTSGLNLPGAPAPRSVTQPLSPPRPPEFSLDTGVARARNVASAFAMIGVLLLRFIFVKVLGSRLAAVRKQAILVTARVLYALLIFMQPHMARWRSELKRTTNVVKRLLLIALITTLAPVERGISVTVKHARAQGGRLAVQGARVTVKVLGPMLVAVSQVVRAGFKKATVQRALGRLIQILDEAQR